MYEVVGKLEFLVTELMNFKHHCSLLNLVSVLNTGFIMLLSLRILPRFRIRQIVAI